MLIKIRLLNRNIECGTLHCQGGIPKPMMPQSTYSSHTQTVNGQEVQCKVTSAMYSPETGGDDPGMVADGTKCGDDMVSRPCVQCNTTHPPRL